MWNTIRIPDSSCNCSEWDTAEDAFSYKCSSLPVSTAVFSSFLVHFMNIWTYFQMNVIYICNIENNTSPTNRKNTDKIFTRFQSYMHSTLSICVTIIWVCLNAINTTQANAYKMGYNRRWKKSNGKSIQFFTKDNYAWRSQKHIRKRSKNTIKTDENKKVKLNKEKKRATLDSKYIGSVE